MGGTVEEPGNEKAKADSAALKAGAESDKQ